MTDEAPARPAMVTDATLRDTAEWLWDFAEDADYHLNALAPDHPMRKEYEGHARRLFERLAMHQSAMSGDVVERIMLEIEATPALRIEGISLTYGQVERGVTKAIASLMGSRTEG